MKKTYLFIQLILVFLTLTSCVNFLGLKDTGNALKVENPVLTADSEEAGSIITVTIVSNTINASIIYTKDGSTPSENAGIAYTGPFTVSNLGINTVKALAYKKDYIDSDVVTKTYTINGALPSPTLADNSSFPVPQSIIIPVMNGTEVYYTTDTTSPSKTNGIKITTDKILYISSSTTVKAVAYKNNWTPSPIITRTYTITGTCPPPVLSDGGIFTSSQDIIIQVPQGYNVRYTTDKTTPSSTNGTDITVDTVINIPLNTSITFKAVSYKTNWLSSEVMSRVYTITGKVDQPVLTSSQTYFAPQDITIPVVTGTKVRYTLDGVNPSRNYGFEIESETIINLKSTTTLKALAMKNNWEDSEITTRIYKITGIASKPFFNIDGTTSTEALRITMQTSTPGAEIYYTLDGLTDPNKNNAIKYTRPVTVSETMTIKARTIIDDWATSDLVTEAYTITGVYDYYDMWYEAPKPGTLSHPLELDTDKNGNVYVADSRNYCIQVFDQYGNFIKKFDTLGSPRGIAVDNTGDIYVTYAHNTSPNLQWFIDKYDANGKYLLRFEQTVNCSWSIDVDKYGYVYVNSIWGGINNNYIKIFSPEGKIISNFGGSIYSNGIWTIKIDSSNDFIYVTDQERKDVQKLDLSGNFISKIDPTGDYALIEPNSVEVDNDGNIFIVDGHYSKSCIYKYDKNGNYITKWGSLGPAKGQLNGPYDISINKDNLLYITDKYNNRIQIFKPSGAFYGLIEYSPGDKQFNFLKAVYADPYNDNIFVADSDNHRILKFSLSGNLLSKWGSAGSASGQFFNPNGLITDKEGNVIVLDTANHRLQKFTNSGTFLFKTGSYGTSNGQFNNPWDAAVHQNGDIFVVEENNNRVQIFDSNFNFRAKWDDIGLSRPCGIAIDLYGFIYISDQDNHRILKYDTNKNLITSWGEYGSGDNQFKYPIKIAIDSANFIYVADNSNHCIKKFRSDGTFITKIGSEGVLSGQFQYSAGVAVDSWGNLYVADTANQRVQIFKKK